VLDPLASPSPRGQAADLPVAQRHQGDLGGGEEALDQDEHQDQYDLEAEATHRESSRTGRLANVSPDRWFLVREIRPVRRREV
jgi:hypothetical protein